MPARLFIKADRCQIATGCPKPLAKRGSRANAACVQARDHGGLDGPANLNAASETCVPVAPKHDITDRDTCVKTCLPYLD